MKQYKSSQSSIKKPNTFIVGAPKCGTTALSEYLRAHPQVFVSSPKEPHHFVYEDMPKKSKYNDLDKYLELFKEAGDQHKIIMEASVWYLFSEKAIEKIHAFDPASKIIIMLRRPDEMVYSMHNQAVITFNDDILDFTQAWQSSLNNKKRASYPKLCKEPRLLDYNKIANYSAQIENVLKFFPKSQVFIIFYDDFKANTESVFSDTLSFLGIEQVPLGKFEKINKNRTIKNRVLGRFIKEPPQFMLKLASKIKTLLGIRKLGILSRLSALNSVETKRAELPEAVRLDIVNHYRSDILRLQTLAHRDLSDWLK
ncbi:MAG: sulfotransferase domain-containing protein [Gammaproteobacteria bacterium]|nr:sulfotransferase domain-containing protein [Gammaproteobacteria bacterium]